MNGSRAVASVFTGAMWALALAVVLGSTADPPHGVESATMCGVTFVCAALGMWLLLGRFLPSRPSIGLVLWRAIVIGGAGGVLAILVLVFTYGLFHHPVDAPIAVVLIIGGGAGGFVGVSVAIVSGFVAAWVLEQRMVDAFERVLFVSSSVLLVFSIVVGLFQNAGHAERGREGVVFTGLAAIGLAISLAREVRRRKWLGKLDEGWTIERRTAKDDGLPVYGLPGGEMLVRRRKADGGGPFRGGDVTERVAQLDRDGVRRMARRRVMIAGAGLVLALAAQPFTLAVHELGPRPPEPHPTLVAGPAAKRIAVGDDFACMITFDDRLACWGNTAGSLMLSVSDAVWTPVKSHVGHPKVLSLGERRLCLIEEPGSSRATCWGHGDDLPVKDVGPENAVEVALAPAHWLILASDGRVWQQDEPVPWRSGHALTDVEDMVHIAAAPEHACGIKRNGEVWCWGANYDGCVRGDAWPNWRKPEVLPPTRVPGIENADRIVLGIHSSWARANGRWYSWGSNFERDYAFGETQGGEVHAVSNTEHVQEIVVTSSYICGLSDDGAVQCWTAAPVGEKAKRREMDGLPPASAVEIAGSREQVCARRAAGDVRCWGTR